MQVFEGVVSRAELRRQLAELQGKRDPISERTVRRWEVQGLPVIRRGQLRLYEIDKARAWLFGQTRRGSR